MTTFAFVFARGGSKGLRRKNIKLLNGKPLIQYSIETALRLESIDRIFVSTDNDEIADLSFTLGAIVIRRPAALATDSSKEWLSWQHAIEWTEEKYGKFDTFVSLPATSPLRSDYDVQASIKQLNDSGADICISITEASRSPYFNMVTQDPTGLVKVVNSVGTDFVRRQDVPEVFDITTVVYSTRPSYVINSNGLFDGNVTSILVPKERAVDIDDIYDFKFAEVLLKDRNNARK